MNVIPCTGAVFRKLIEGRGGEVFVDCPLSMAAPHRGLLRKMRGPVPLVPLLGMIPAGEDHWLLAHFRQGDDGLWGIDAEKDGWLMKGTA